MESTNITFENKSNKENPHINVVFIGQLDSGKSTTIGHLLSTCGLFRPFFLERLERESTSIGRSSFKYAWILDKLKSERERGLTIVLSFMKIKTEKYNITLIDTPGHRDFTKHMINGISQADVAVMVCDSTEGSFESGYSKEGQIKEQIYLAFTMGIKQVIIAINKMDICNYSEQRFNEIKNRMTYFMKGVGFKENNLNFVAYSGYEGVNLIYRYNDNNPDRENPMRWYKGDTLYEAINKINLPKRLIDLPLRIPILDIFKITGVGTVVCGVVKSGKLKADTLVHIAPCNFDVECREIEIHHTSIKKASSGDYIGLHLKNISIRDLKKGFVIGDTKNDSPKEVIEFESQLMVINHPNSIKSGYSPVIDCHTTHIPVKFVKILKKIDQSGKVIEEEPKEIRNGEIAIVLMKPLKKFVCETYAKYGPLGRFSIRDLTRVVAVGAIKKVTKK